jgi:uncharacterized integral membrane protein
MRQVRWIAGAVAGVLLVLFVLLNLRTVRIHFLIGEFETPLAVGLILAALCGGLMAGGIMLLVSRRKRDSSPLP